MRDYQAAADLIRAAYANDGNGHLGTGVHVRFEALREAIAAAIEKERAAELDRIKMFLCEECRRGTPIDPDGGHHRQSTVGDTIFFDCVWKELGL